MPGRCQCGPAVTRNARFDSAEDLTRRFVAHIHSAPAAQSNYTFLILHHDLNYIHGKLTSDHTTKSEQIFLAGFPYIRLLERDGKPLSGKDLNRENDLYGKALEERKGTEVLRALQKKGEWRSTQGIPIDHLVSDFHSSLAGREVREGRECVVLELTPLKADASPALQRHIRLSIDVATLDLLHSSVEYLATDNGFGQGTTFEQDNFYLNNELLHRSFRLDTTVQVKAFMRKAEIHLIGTDEYTDYRRFRTTVTVRPADEPRSAPFPVPQAPH